MNRKYDKSVYRFLPDGWYFKEDLYDYDRPLDLYTDSDTWIAREYDDRIYDRKLSVYEGLEHEREYIKSLFGQKSNADRVRRDAEMARDEVERKTKATKTMEQIQKDFAKINKTISVENPDHPMDSEAIELSNSLNDLENRLSSFYSRMTHS